MSAASCAWPSTGCANGRPIRQDPERAAAQLALRMAYVEHRRLLGPVGDGSGTAKG